PVSNFITMVKFKYADFRKALAGGKKIVVELPDEGILPVGHLLSFMPIYHIEPRDLEPFCRVWEMKVGQSWSKSWLRLWEKLVKEARTTRKDENWIRSSNPRGITLNDWPIYMSYMYGEEFQDLIQKFEANRPPTAWGPHDSLAQAVNKDDPRGRLQAGGVGKNKTL
ncbi:hypothetical protein LINPERPRIM_LOCUS27865, partial [Linum perenne]